MKKLIVSIVVLLCAVTAAICYGYKKSYDAKVTQNKYTNELFDQNQKIYNSDLESEPKYFENKIKELILKEYNAKEFSDIYAQNKDDLLGQIYSITVLNQGVDALKDVEVRFTNLYDTVNAQIAREQALRILRICSTINSLNSVTARFDTYDGRPYYQEKVLMSDSQLSLDPDNSKVDEMDQK